MAKREMWTMTKRRWSGAPSIPWQAEFLGDDEWGAWFLAPSRTQYVDEGGWFLAAQTVPYLLLVPPDAPFVATFATDNAKIDLAADNVVDHDARAAEFMDVELDVLWGWGEAAGERPGLPGSAAPRIVDREEFDALGLPEDVRAEFVSAAETLLQMVIAGEPPFVEAQRLRLHMLAKPQPDDVPLGWAMSLSAANFAHAARTAPAAVLGEWGGRQRAGEGWMFVGGTGFDLVEMLGWVAKDGASRVVFARDSDEAERLSRMFFDLVPELAGYPAPPLDVV